LPRTGCLSIRNRPPAREAEFTLLRPDSFTPAEIGKAGQDRGKVEGKPRSRGVWVFDVLASIGRQFIDGTSEGERMSISSEANIKLTCALLIASLAVAVVSNAAAQYACTTNYCIQSQSVTVETPPGWPAVPVETCCQTHWGALPGGIDWGNGAPVMICSASADYSMVYPNCGGPTNLSQAFPLSYENPKIGIGVAWPNAKDYRYEMQSVPMVDGPDGTCARYSHQPGKVVNWWVHELKDAKRGTYVFTARVSFQQGEKGYYAVLNECKLTSPAASGPSQP
jgi:hypothetical protein